MRKMRVVMMASLGLISLTLAGCSSPFGGNDSSVPASGIDASTSSTAVPVVKVLSTTVLPVSSGNALTEGGYGSSTVTPNDNLGSVAPQISSVPSGDVAITIDQGPSPYTPEILHTLKKFNVKVTFFDVGENVLKYPDALKAEVTQGEVIGNNTYSFPMMSNLSWSAQSSEINMADQDIQKYDSNPIEFYCPPNGVMDTTTYELLSNHRMSVVLGNLDPEKSTDDTSKQLITAIKNDNESGAIINIRDSQVTAEALPTILQILHNKGLHFVVFTAPSGWNGTPISKGSPGYYSPPSSTPAVSPDAPAQPSIDRQESGGSDSATAGEAGQSGSVTIEIPAPSTTAEHSSTTSHVHTSGSQGTATHKGGNTTTQSKTGNGNSSNDTTGTTQRNTSGGNTSGSGGTTPPPSNQGSSENSSGGSSTSNSTSSSGSSTLAPPSFG